MVMVSIDGYVEHIKNHTFIIYANDDHYVVRSNRSYVLNEYVSITGTLKSKIVGSIVTYEIIEA
jgi:hypothetical protein